MLTAQQAREIASKRNNSTKELNKVEDSILLALRKNDGAIYLQLEEQQTGNKEICTRVTKEILEQLKDFGFKVEGPIELIVDIHEDFFKDVMCYRISW